MSGMLSARDREVMLLAAEGLSDKEIARRLKISQFTTKSHLQHVCRKLGVHNRTLLATLVWSARKKETAIRFVIEECQVLINERGRLIVQRPD
jgi:DNA-binding CsgD family transcriptional regulator